jgi:hypothetical protein
MFLPVDRSITVSAPQRIDHTIFSTSSSMLDVTAELPMLALIFTRKLRPMIIGSAFGVVDVGRDDGAAAGHFVAHELGRDGRLARPNAIDHSRRAG